MTRLYFKSPEVPSIDLNCSQLISIDMTSLQVPWSAINWPKLISIDTWSDINYSQLTSIDMASLHAINWPPWISIDMRWPELPSMDLYWSQFSYLNLPEVTLTWPQLTSIHISSNQFDFSLPHYWYDLKSLQLTIIDLTKWHYLSTHLNLPEGTSAYCISTHLNSLAQLSPPFNSPGATSAWWAGKFARWACSHDPATRLATCSKWS